MKQTSVAKDGSDDDQQVVLCARFQDLTRSRLRNPIFKDEVFRSITIGLGKESSHILGNVPLNLSTPRPSAKPKLLNQARDAIRCKHSRIRTEQAYFDGILRVSRGAKAAPTFWASATAPFAAAEVGAGRRRRRRGCVASAKRGRCCRRWW
jgi:hypothetical protein